MLIIILKYKPSIIKETPDKCVYLIKKDNHRR